MPIAPPIVGSSWRKRKEVPIKKTGVNEIMGIASEISVVASARLREDCRNDVQARRDGNRKENNGHQLQEYRNARK